RRALPLSRQEILQRSLVEQRLRQQPLQQGILLFQRLQPLRVGYFHPAKLGLPRVERRAADPVSAAQIRRLRTSLLLSQDADDLFLSELRSLHGPVLFVGRTLASDGGGIGGQSNGLMLRYVARR